MKGYHASVMELQRQFRYLQPLPKRRLFGLVWLVGVMSFSPLSSGWAQVDSESTYQFDDIVVTGNPLPKTVDDSPIPTEIIRETELKKNHLRNLQQALELRPSSNFSNIRGQQQASGVSFQGMQPDHTLILVDGIPQNTSFLALDTEQFQLNDIERIEILKGASSALYGSAAMGGVINLITRKPKKSFEYTLLQQVDPTRSITRLKAGSRQENWSQEVSLQYNPLFNYDLDPSTYSFDGAQGYNLNVRPTAIYHPNTRFSIEAGYVRAENQWNFDLAETTADGLVPYFNRNRYLRNQWHLISDWRPSTNLQVKTLLSAETFNSRQSSRDFARTPFEDQVKSGSLETYRAEVQTSVTPSDFVVLTSGVVSQFQRLDVLTTTQSSPTEIASNKDIDQKSIRSLEGYLQADLILGNWEWIPGLRVQHDADFGSFIAPKLSVKWNAIDQGSFQTHLRASVGTGYKVPSMVERFYVLDHSANLGYQVLGNPNLDPESSLSLQVGPEFTWSRASVTINGFYHDVENLLVYVDQGNRNGIQTYQFANQARTASYGAETSLQAKWLDDTLSTQFAYTYLISRDRATNQDLIFRPRHVLTSQLRYQFYKQKADLIMQFRYQSDEPVSLDGSVRSPSWLRTDLKLNLELASDWVLFMGLDNLFDVHRTGRQDEIAPQIDRRPPLGRTVYIGLSLSNT